jgi:prolipoprotein diacylglyceryltransferase
MDVNATGSLIILIISFVLCLVGFVIAIIFFIMARSKTDPITKKKYDRRAIWSFLGPIILVVISRLIYSIIFYSAH